MNDTSTATIFVGLDVHKKTIAVATVEARASADVRFYGTHCEHTSGDSVVAEEAWQRWPSAAFSLRGRADGLHPVPTITGLGHRCDVVAPSLIPRKVGDKVKTDRRDAMMLAQTLRAGQLTEVWVPDEAHEAMRDLVRMRALAMKDQRKARQQLHSFLLRHGRSYPGQPLDQGAPSLAWRVDIRSTGAASRARGALGTDRAGRGAVRPVEGKPSSNWCRNGHWRRSLQRCKPYAAYRSWSPRPSWPRSAISAGSRTRGN